MAVGAILGAAEGSVVPEVTRQKQYKTQPDHTDASEHIHMHAYWTNGFGPMLMMFGLVRDSGVSKVVVCRGERRL